MLLQLLVPETEACQELCLGRAGDRSEDIIVLALCHLLGEVG